MLYHPQSGYYRQFLSVTAKQRMKKVEQVVNAHVTKNMPNVNPGSVGLWSTLSQSAIKSLIELWFIFLFPLC